jgi:hypothetical protein
LSYYEISTYHLADKISLFPRKIPLTPPVNSPQINPTNSANVLFNVRSVDPVNLAKSLFDLPPALFVGGLGVGFDLEALAFEGRADTPRQLRVHEVVRLSPHHHNAHLVRNEEIKANK